MKDWRKHYEDHLVTMQDAANSVKSSDTLSGRPL